jgi:hypothetical protein
MKIGEAMYRNAGDQQSSNSDADKDEKKGDK